MGRHRIVVIRCRQTGFRTLKFNVNQTRIWSGGNVGLDRRNDLSLTRNNVPHLIVLFTVKRSLDVLHPFLFYI